MMSVENINPVASILQVVSHMQLIIVPLLYTCSQTQRFGQQICYILAYIYMVKLQTSLKLTYDGQISIPFCGIKDVWS